LSASKATPTVAANTAGPAVSGVTRLTAHGKITGIVIHFNDALSSASASNSANYSVRLLKVGRRPGILGIGVRRATPHGTVGIRSVQYDSNARAVTLTLGSRLPSHQRLQLTVSGGQGGITNSAGHALNSPSQGTPGSDATFTVN
jgi:hypothetical protein